MANQSLITVDTEILGGTPVFTGTRVPVKTLFDYLEDNYSLDEFLECFPTVSREMDALNMLGILRFDEETKTMDFKERTRFFYSLVDDFDLAMRHRHTDCCGF